MDQTSHTINSWLQWKKQDLIKEKVNKFGKKMFQGPRMIATSTVHCIQEKLFQSGVNVSIGTLMPLKSFFINYATEFC